jgi:hypothetical protein
MAHKINGVVNQPVGPLPEARPVRMVINIVYISNSNVVVNTPSPDPPGFREWLENTIHLVKTSGVQIVVCIASLIALWAFLHFDVTRVWLH